MRKILLVVVAVLALTATASAATKNGITPKTPKQGSKVDVGSRPTFSGKVSGKGVMYIHVSKSKRTDSKGVIGSDATIQKAKRKSNGTFTMKADFFDFPDFWLNSPGTYYWQAHRIQCEGSTSDCLMEGPIVKFKVG